VNTDFCKDFQAHQNQRETYETNTNTRLEHLAEIDASITTLTRGLEKAALTFDIQPQIDDLKKTLESAAATDALDTVIDEVKDTITTGFQDVWADLGNRPTSQAFRDLDARLKILEAAVPNPGTIPGPTPGPTPDNPDGPVVVPVTGPDPPIWMTYSRNEPWSKVAEALSITPAEKLKTYNQALTQNMDSDTKRFWASPVPHSVVDKAVVFIPDSGTSAPCRTYGTNNVPFFPNTGEQIAKYFGYPADIPPGMVEIETWRFKEGQLPGRIVVKKERYEDHVVMIPAIKYNG
jgi:hypothetical protein